MIGVWAVRNLVRHPIRTGLVVLGVAVAAALLLDMTMLSGGMERSFRDMLLSRGFQIRLSPKGTLPFDTEATLPEATRIVTTLRADPAIVAAGVALGTPVYAEAADSLVTLVGYGIDPLGQGLYQLDRGRDLGPADTTGLLITERVATVFGWNLGDTVRLAGRLDPQSADAQAERAMVVRGMVTWLYDARDQLSVGAHYRTVQGLGRFTDPDPASMIMVKVADTEDVEAVATRLAAQFPAIQVNSVGAMVAKFRARLVYFQQLSLILATISLVVAVLLVATILAITINERLGEVAVLRAIGVSRARLVALVVAEGAAITVVGTGLGVLLGLLTARRLDAILTSFPGLPAAISFFVPEPTALVRAALTMGAAGLVAAAYPAWLAAQAPIAETLRAEAE
ncbi:MAG: ABC transporter permease [Gemmatimonadales bacterium]